MYPNLRQVALLGGSWLLAVTLFILFLLGLGGFKAPSVTAADNPLWNSRSSGVTQNLNGVACTSATTCLVVGDAGTLLVSTDAGSSWTTKSLTTTQNLTGLSCPTTLSCFVLGDPLAVDQQLLSTADGGLNWQVQSTGLTEKLTALSCPGADACLAATTSGRVALTATGGTSWITRTATTDGGLTAISCPGPATNQCWTVGYTTTPYVRDFILVTTDGGNSWNQQSSLNYNKLQTIDCYDTSSCLVAGANVYLGSHARATTNGGFNWFSATVPNYWPYGTSFYGVDCPRSDSCALVGANGTVVLTGAWVNPLAITATTGVSPTLSTYVTATTGITQTLHSVSCRSLVACLAVGNGGTILSNAHFGFDSFPAQDGEQLQFRRTTPGTPVTTTLQLYNTGATDLTISNPLFTGPQAAELRLLSPALPQTLSPGNVPYTLVLECTPAAWGPRTATLSLHTSDPNHPMVSYNLRCNGLPGFGSNPFPGSTINLGSSLVGSPVSTTLPLFETGDAPLTIISATVNGPVAEFSLSGVTFPLTIGDAAPPQNLTLKCQPAATGRKTVNLSLTTNDPDLPEVHYNLSCSGYTNTPWQQINTLPRNTYFTQISCPTAAICMAASWQGDILRSEDGGRRWTTQTSGTNLPLVSLVCPTTQVCFALGNANPSGLTLYNQGAGPAGAAILLKTSDGGQTWNTLPPATPANSFEALACPAANQCFLVGYGGLIMASGDGGQSWTRQPSHTSQPLVDLSCLSALVCRAVGMEGISVHTTDGGASWTLQRIAPPGTRLYTISCSDGNRCYAAGDNGSTQSSVSPVLVATTNGGASWTVVNTGLTDPIFSLACPAPNTCLARIGNSVRYSTEGGLNWQYQAGAVYSLYNWPKQDALYCFSSTLCFASGSPKDNYNNLDMTIVSGAGPGGVWHSLYGASQSSLYSIFCPDALHCWAVNYNGLLEITKDGGQSWTMDNYPGPVRAVYCLNTSLCVAAGSAGKIARTEDGGQNWTIQNSGVSTFFFGITCPSTSVCYAVGLGGEIVATTDSGVTWNRQISNTSAQLLNISCPTTQTCFAAGYTFSPTNGAIVMTTNGGATWTVLRAGTSQDDTYGDINCPSTLVCYVTTSYTKLYKTINGGSSWNVTYEHTPGSAAASFGISCLNVNQCYAVGQGNKAIMTADGGTSWQAQQPGVPSILWDVSCPMVDLCYSGTSSGEVMAYRLPGSYTSSPVMAGGLIELGGIQVGKQVSFTLSVTNQGNAPLTLSNPRISGPNPTEFSLVTPSLPLSVPSGSTQSLTLRCLPEAAGSRSATLTLSTDDPLRPTVSYQLSCNGLALVNENQDDGSGSQPGTLSYLLTNQRVGAGQAITIEAALKISISGPLPPVPKGVGIRGSCQFPAVLNGKGVSANGLVLQGNSSVEGLQISGFSLSQLKISGKSNRVVCVKASR